MSELFVQQFRHGPLWNFSYLVACEETRQAAIIDPAWDAAAILRSAETHGFEVRHVLLTHGHTDHVNGVEEVLQRTDARAFIHFDEAVLLPTNAVTFSYEETLELGQHVVHLWPAPGHSEGSSSFWVDGHLFSGDTLQVGTVGRAGAYPGAVEQLWHSVRELIELPSDTVLYPGHDEGQTRTSTLRAEVARVAALRAPTAAEFEVELRRATGWDRAI